LETESRGPSPRLSIERRTEERAIQQDLPMRFPPPARGARRARYVQGAGPAGHHVAAWAEGDRRPLQKREEPVLKGFRLSHTAACARNRSPKGGGRGRGAPRIRD